MCFRGAFPMTWNCKTNKCYHQLWNESVKKPWAEWTPCVSDRRYLCSSIKDWAVIKAHFDLNECKLAHLLWWSSCPDSSISMIDQLSSCWWLIGDGSWGTSWVGVVRENKKHRRKNSIKLYKTCIHWIRVFFFSLD